METALDLTLYQLILTQLAEKPDLSVVQERQPLPESWPLVLKSVETFRSQLKCFVVTDGTHDAVCCTNVPEVQSRVMKMEAGSILHLIGAETRFMDAFSSYGIEFEGLCTLKEFDDRLKEQRLAEEKRLAWMKEQGYIEEEAVYDVATSVEPVGVASIDIKPAVSTDSAE